MIKDNIKDTAQRARQDDQLLLQTIINNDDDNDSNIYSVQFLDASTHLYMRVCPSVRASHVFSFTANFGENGC